jgi:hypothetical protein
MTSHVVPDHLEQRLVVELSFDPRNPRTHPKREVNQLVASISTYGFTSPILIDGANMIIAGNGRVLAARKLGMASVPVIVLSSLEGCVKTLQASGMLKARSQRSAGIQSDFGKTSVPESTSACWRPFHRGDVARRCAMRH